MDELSIRIENLFTSPNLHVGTEISSSCPVHSAREQREDGFAQNFISDCNIDVFNYAHKYLGFYISNDCLKWKT